MSHALIQRRVAQIRAYFAPMRSRQREAGKNVFLIFDEAAAKTSGHATVPLGMTALSFEELRTRTAPEREPARFVGKDVGFRFVQFGFHEDGFLLDLPQQTLHADEAAALLNQRSGFFYLQEKAGETQLVRECNPLEKDYAYGEEAIAVDDMLFLMLSVWNIPLTFRWFVTSFASGGAMEWEVGEPMA